MVLMPRPRKPTTSDANIEVADWDDIPELESAYVLKGGGFSKRPKTE